MTKFILLQDGHTAHRRLPDGTIEQKRFTSRAQARQFVEKQNGDGPMAFRTTRPANRQELRKRRNHKAPLMLTPNQLKLREKVLEQADFEKGEAIQREKLARLKKLRKV